MLWCKSLHTEFKKRNGSLNCGELLGLKKKAPVSSEPEARTEQYYAKRPCSKMVEEAARIWAEYLEKRRNSLQIDVFITKREKVTNNLLYNIIITIFAVEIKPELFGF